ncbi:Myeloid leukemia factor [Macleaya cordata]|uniref:Myeloid leukemia factor n=1 Tax=Macleaya cordata TaxID=56857 RepID=A0A200QB29_MACCD|nr:Myeloid leukemia factor [Macleaya cordata]
MERGRGGRDDFFGDPFGGFGGFGGGFGGHQNLVSSFFGGRDPFDDPFFTRPFGSSMLGPSMFGPSMFGQSMFGPSMFGPSGSPFGDSHASGFIQNQPAQVNKSKGPVIEEINSDEEGEEEKEAGEKKENPKKHSRSSKEPYVEDPDDAAEERKNKLMQYRNEYNKADRTQPQTQSFSFQSSTVTYGGVNGAYYTSSTSRKMGTDGVVVEESKEADTTTGKAAHRLSRGIRDKGHSVTRKLNPDGKVATMQTLHNLDEDELPVFEEAWKGSARKHLPGWDEGFNVHANTGPRSSGQHQQTGTSRGWALPSTEQEQPQPQLQRNPEWTGSHSHRGILQEEEPK